MEPYTSEPATRRYIGRVKKWVNDEKLHHDIFDFPANSRGHIILITDPSGLYIPQTDATVLLSRAPLPRKEVSILRGTPAEIIDGNPFYARFIENDYHIMCSNRKKRYVRSYDVGISYTFLPHPDHANYFFRLMRMLEDRDRKAEEMAKKYLKKVRMSSFINVPDLQ